MLTRILALGNAIIVSGAVARGPYWHMLETCIFTPAFNPHMTAVFKAVAARMGLAHHRLFEIYANQIAWTISVDYPDKQAEQDFLHVDPTVLGYDDQRAFATASFRFFAPAYVYPYDGTAVTKMTQICQLCLLRRLAGATSVWSRSFRTALFRIWSVGCRGRARRIC